MNRQDDSVTPGEARFLVTSDPNEIDVGAVVDFLTTGVPWGRWRSREQVARQVESAWRLVGVTDLRTGRTVAFARAVSDGVSLAYLADVYVLPEYRGQGLSRLVLEEMIEKGPGRLFRWMLHTDDAHGLYAKFGFSDPTQKYLERPGPPTHPLSEQFD